VELEKALRWQVLEAQRYFAGDTSLTVDTDTIQRRS
jgi:hypothetical protein